MTPMRRERMKAIFFANTDWYLWNFRLALARALQRQGWEVVLVSPPGQYHRRLEAEGFRWVPMQFSRGGVNPFAELRTLMKLVSLYRGERPDVAHHFTVKCVLYGGIAAWAAGTRATVSSMTGLGTLFTTDTLRGRLVKPVAKLMYRFVLRRSTVIFQNPDDRKEFASLGLVDETRCQIIRGSGVDIARFVPPASPLNGRDETVLLVGRLLAEKGIREFVEAARIVKARRPSVRFVVAGTADPGNPTSIDARTLDAWRAEGHVEFCGHCENILELLHSCDVAALPSYREGTPRSLLEAAACGLPLVASDVPGCREVVRHGDNGLLVPARDSAALAEAILALLVDSGKRRSMGARSREIAIHDFAQEKVIKATLNAYEVALGQ
jgi:glycosyltransferase involved in cell wall biosynthesis